MQTGSKRLAFSPSSREISPGEKSSSLASSFAIRGIVAVEPTK